MAYFYGKGVTAPLNAEASMPNVNTTGKGSVIGCINNCDSKFDIATQYDQWKACVDGCKQTPDSGGGGGTGGGGGGSTATCPEGSGAKYDGCGCGTEYYTKTGNCPSGYGFVKKTDKPGYVGKCYCEKWVNETDPAVTGKGTSSLGEYKYPAEISEMMNLLLSRGKDLLGMPLGYSQEAQDKMFGRNFENVRAQQGGTREALNRTLGSQGMLGTGTATKLAGQSAWANENAVSDLSRELFVANELQKKSDLLNYTGAANTLMGTGMGYEQLLEAINSSRRGEGQTALALFLQWLSQAS
jgi:hypothetical protein